MANRIKHGLELFGSTLLYGGIIATVYFTVTGKPRLHAEIAGLGVAFGVVLLIAHGISYGNEVERNAKNPLEVVGVLASLVGIAMYPLGAIMQHLEYRVVAVTGFLLLATGMVIIAANEDLNEQSTTDAVPDDPTNILNEDE